MIGDLTPQDLGDFMYDWRTYSIFFESPVSVTVPGVGEFTVGSGLGGFSPSIFVRGMKCIACGRCCYGHERVWTWFETPGGRFPDDTVRLIITVNGHPLPLRAHVNRGNPRVDGCDYLVQKGELSLDGVTPSKGFCRLWRDGLDLPTHCRQLPDYGVYPVRTSRGTVPLLSRRLPPRNWRSPQCPINVQALPLDDTTLEKDRRVWRQWVDGLTGLPGSKIDLIYALWERYVTSPPTGVIFFQDHV